MGQVYQATDTKLNRQVALKILPEAFATDPDRLARFQREAQVLASLNHPNIAAIHGLEESDGIRALVLELVEGPTLADRISQGPIPVDETLPIAKQIAEALARIIRKGSDFGSQDGVIVSRTKDRTLPLSSAGHVGRKIGRTTGPLRAACRTAPPWAVSRSPVTREGGANVRASLGGRRARGRCAATRGGPGWRSAGGGRCGAPRRRRGPPV